MNQIDLAGKVAVVTGGAQGIGLAIAQRVIQSGARVEIWDRDQEALDGGLAVLGESAAGRRVELTDAAGVAAATEAAASDHGRIDIYCANAGIAGPNTTLWDYPLEAWRQVIDIDLHAVFYGLRAVAPVMIRQNYGRIICTASIAGKEGNPNASAYSTAKAGVVAMVKSLGKELAGYDIAVNAITPAAARTRIFDQMTEEHIGYMLSKIPRGRFVEVEEIAAMVAWLASAENSFTTGAVFDLSGGRATY